MNTPQGSPVILHLEFGADFIKAMLERYGAEAWNRWLSAMLDCMPMSWPQGAPEPPAHMWFDAEEADFTGRNLDGIDLRLVNCEGARFDQASATGALFGDCPRATFLAADLRDAGFTGDISGAVFTDARLDGLSLVDAFFDAECPPIGLPEALLRACCRIEHADEPADTEPTVGLFEHPVTIRASLAASAHL
jgi:uncharacterized protein YjbI with pentapeptide repeats